MARTTRYDRLGRVTGWSETPDRPRKLTKAEQEAQSKAAIFLAALAAALVALGPVLAPFALLNIWLSTTVVMEWHLLFRIFIFGATNLATLGLLVFVVRVTRNPLLKICGAIAYAAYGFTVVAAMTSPSKWPIASVLPAGLVDWTGNLQNGDVIHGDVIWSVLGSVVAAIFGWFLFGFIKSMVSRFFSQ